MRLAQARVLRAVKAVPPSPSAHARCHADPERQGRQDARAPRTDADAPQVPWSISTYFTKKTARQTDELGNFVGQTQVAEPPGWHADSKLALAVQIVSRELAMPEPEAWRRLQLLKSLLPDLAERRSSLKAADLVRLSADVSQIAEALLVLREALPHANVSKLVAGHPELLQLGVPQLYNNLACVSDTLSRSGCPPEEWQALLEQAPYLADPHQLQATLGEIAKLFGAAAAGEGQAACLLVRQPWLALSLQGLQHQARGDRDTEYMADWSGRGAVGRATRREGSTS